MEKTNFQIVVRAAFFSHEKNHESSNARSIETIIKELTEVAMRAELHLYEKAHPNSNAHRIAPLRKNSNKFRYLSSYELR